MLRAIAAMSLVILCCPVGCAPSEEDTADPGQPIHSDAGGGSADSPASDAASDTMPALDIRALPLATPELAVDPTATWDTTIARFVVTNIGTKTARIETFSVEFGELCTLIDTAVLKNGSSVVSDGSCEQTMSFTLDADLKSRESFWLTVNAISKTGVEAALVAYRRLTLPPLHGPKAVAVSMPEGVQHISHAESAPIKITTRAHTYPSICHDIETDTDRPYAGIEFMRSSTGFTGIDRNDIFEFGFRIRSSNLEENGTTEFTIRLQETGVIPTRAIVATMRENAVLWEAAIEGDRIHISLPNSALATDQMYCLYLLAPGSRGTIRLHILPEDMPPPGGGVRTGCYPTMTLPIIILPIDEWSQYL